VNARRDRLHPFASTQARPKARMESPMETFDAIRSRRSIKPDKMKPDPVDRAALERIFEAARWAPTHGMTEPWRFIVFEGDARKQLANAVIETMAKDGEVIAENDARREKAIKNFTTPPIVVAIVCQASTNPKIVEHEEVISTAIAAHNMMLAAREMGVATYWTSGDKAFHPRMAKFLGIAPPAKCLGFMYVGWPAISWPDGTRTPITDKVTWRR
jgi:nitroreductase